MSYIVLLLLFSAKRFIIFQVIYYFSKYDSCVVHCKHLLYNYKMYMYFGHHGRKKKFCQKKNEYDIKRQSNVLKIYLERMLHLFAAAKRTQMHAIVKCL